MKSHEHPQNTDPNDHSQSHPNQGNYTTIHPSSSDLVQDQIPSSQEQQQVSNENNHEHGDKDIDHDMEDQTEEFHDCNDSESKEEEKVSEQEKKSDTNTDQNKRHLTTEEKLKELGYYINKDENEYGVLTQIEGNAKGIVWKGQQNYDQIGDLVVQYIQDEMQKEEYGSLEQVWIPEDETIEEMGGDVEVMNKKYGKCNIFMSKEFRRNKIQNQEGGESQGSPIGLVLIQGTGAVRAGIWARSVCINDRIETGSVLPLLKRAKAKNIPVIVLNPNLRRDPRESEPSFGKPALCCDSMERHTLFVWEQYIAPSPVQKFRIIAHSAGGGCLTDVQNRYKKKGKNSPPDSIGEFYDRADAIAYTDSWTVSKSDLTKDQFVWMQKHAIHYIASNDEVGKVLSRNSAYSVCPEKSAGHPKHEYTTGYAYPEIFKQFGLE